jgi:hypothetical protein
MLIIPPQKAWIKYLKSRINHQRWIEDSSKIPNIGLSNRELFGLIILTHIINNTSGNSNWNIGFDKNQPEPNDGFITDGRKSIFFEHKLVTQMTNDEVLAAILATYNKYSSKGPQYGSNLTLIIYCNKTTKNAIRISDLKTEIEKGQCPFDSVLFMGAVPSDTIKTKPIIHTHEYYPETGFASVTFSVVNGTAHVVQSTRKVLSTII